MKLQYLKCCGIGNIIQQIRKAEKTDQKKQVYLTIQYVKEEFSSLWGEISVRRYPSINDIRESGQLPGKKKMTDFYLIFYIKPIKDFYVRN